MSVRFSDAQMAPAAGRQEEGLAAEDLKDAAEGEERIASQVGCVQGRALKSVELQHFADERPLRWSYARIRRLFRIFQVSWHADRGIMSVFHCARECMYSFTSMLLAV